MSSTLSLIHIFAEQVAVCAGAGQRQHQNSIFYAVDKQPVRENMTFPMACPIAGQVMVTVLIQMCIRDSNNGAERLRIISQEAPCRTAWNVDPTLEDLYLYYFAEVSEHE